MKEDNRGFDCTDVDIATGTEFLLGDAGDCWATATHWGVTFATSSQRLTITSSSGTTPFTYVPTSTQITVKIGRNATYQAQGNSQIVNPSAAATYLVTLSGTASSQGEFAVAVISGQAVSAEIAESLAFTVSSVLAVNCTVDDGVSATKVGTSPTTVSFGTLNANACYIACQDLIVSTNAGGGYSPTAQEDHPLRTSGGFTIPDTTCGTDDCSSTSASA